MIDLSKDEQDYKNAQEANFWFKQARDEHNLAERLATRIRELNAQLDAAQDDINKLKKLRADDAERFEAITEFWHAARANGYNTSWNIGGVTVEKLREETNLARNYKAPPFILEADLAVVGKMDRDGALYTKGAIVPHKSPIEVVYAYRPKKAFKTTLAEKAKRKKEA